MSALYNVKIGNTKKSEIRHKSSQLCRPTQMFLYVILEDFSEERALFHIFKVRLIYCERGSLFVPSLP